MLKDDEQNQISLFDLGQPETAAVPQERAEVTPPGWEPRDKVPPKKAVATAEKPTAPHPAPRSSRKTTTAPPPATAKTARTAPGPVPEGDVRLTANIREELHLKLKIVAATRRTTIGELIEELVEKYL